jgi:hypothetical protein
MQAFPRTGLDSWDSNKESDPDRASMLGRARSGTHSYSGMAGAYVHILADSVNVETLCVWRASDLSVF